MKNVYKAPQWDADKLDDSTNVSSIRTEIYDLVDINEIKSESYQEKFQ